MKTAFVCVEVSSLEEVTLSDASSAVVVETAGQTATEDSGFT